MSALKQRSLEDYLLLTQQNNELQKIIQSQIQQQIILQSQIQILRSLNLKLKNQNEELKAQQRQYQSSEEKIAVLRALSRDFHKLKQKIQFQQKNNEYLKTLYLGSLSTIQLRQSQITTLKSEREAVGIEVKKLRDRLLAHQEQNQKLRNQIRRLTILNIDQKLGLLEQRNQNTPKRMTKNKSKRRKMVAHSFYDPKQAVWFQSFEFGINNMPS